MKTIDINGEEFEVIESWKYCYALHYNYTGKTLYQFYKKLSETKEEIYDYWHRWYSETDKVQMLQVRSANGFCFTLEALYVVRNTVVGYIEITKSHNRLYIAK